MRKEDNEWEIISDKLLSRHVIEINRKRYAIDDKTAALCHAILLLVDAVNDKKV